MNLLSVSNLKKEFNGETLFDGVSFSIENGDKIGLVGVNGAGKTTLFKILTGELNHDGGEVFASKDLKIGYLSQHALSGENLSIYGEIESVFSRCIELEKALSKLSTTLENAQNGDLHTLIEQQEALLKEYEKAGGYLYKSQIKGTLIGLGFSESDFYREVSSLSGGQKTRLSLAKILLSDCNLLLLDEPTNHLDLTSIVWLESFIKTSAKAIIVISHDRYFLDKTTNFTFDLELGRLTAYKGNYTHFVEQKELRKKTEQRAYDNTSKEIDRLQKSADLLHSFNREKSVKRAESKEKQIDKLKQNLTAVKEVKNDMRFNFSVAETGGKEVITLENLTKRYGENLLFENVTVSLLRGERAFILGANGTGKTTLLKIILGLEQASSGKTELGYRITPAYYDQTLSGLSASTPLEEIHSTYPKMSDTEVRSALARFLFKGEDVFKPLNELSGGEKARLTLLKLMLKGANLLIFDETTNHLDIWARESLENALAGYDGTMLFVSHDRYFIDKLATVIFELDGNNLHRYDGGYEAYLSAKKPTVSKTTQVKENVDYKKKKQLDAEKRKLENAVKKAEKDVSILEEEIDKLTKRLYGQEGQDYIVAEKLSLEIEEKQTLLSSLMTEWENLCLSLESLTER